MQATATARYIRVTPRKARRVVDMIRGLPAEEAQAVLAFAPQSASDTVGKVLASAIANAQYQERTGSAALTVSRAWVNEGPTLKRFRPRAQGRGYRINKRTCHITVIVTDEPAGRGPAVANAAGGRAAQARPAQPRPAQGRPAQAKTAQTKERTR